MSEELVVRQCAPTLAGIKTGSLFSCPCDSPEELRQVEELVNDAILEGYPVVTELSLIHISEPTRH